MRHAPFDFTLHWCYTSVIETSSMPTNKHRVNLSVPAKLDQALHRLATRDELPVASKALELLTRAIELEEDHVLLTVAEEREIKRGKFLSHQSAWK